ncbi:hypothetical protein XELAEV_18046941mg [Xenopus laevis]|uniref:Myosin light chain kinase, smooth muscle n=1 Tax=Xenopus laevis TaxID=8355 RepID=A0A974H131_XENLA|nr:hypothetical protein XELAEV_18046941mg [Xenopus laevis]
MTMNGLNESGKLSSSGLSSGAKALHKEKVSLTENTDTPSKKTISNKDPSFPSESMSNSFSPDLSRESSRTSPNLPALGTKQDKDSHVSSITSRYTSTIESKVRFPKETPPIAQSTSKVRVPIPDKETSSLSPMELCPVSMIATNPVVLRQSKKNSTKEPSYLGASVLDSKNRNVSLKGPENIVQKEPLGQTLKEPTQEYIKAPRSDQISSDVSDGFTPSKKLSSIINKENSLLSPKEQIIEPTIKSTCSSSKDTHSVSTSRYEMTKETRSNVITNVLSRQITNVSLSERLELQKTSELRSTQISTKSRETESRLHRKTKQKSDISYGVRRQKDGKQESLTLSQDGSCSCPVVSDTKETLSLGTVPSFDLSPSSQEVLEGSEVIFRCKVSGDPRPRVEWYKENSVLGERDGCKMEEVVPQFVRELQGCSIMEREDFVLECPVEEQPVPEIIWMLNDNPIQYAHSTYEDRVAKLRVQDALPEDEGVYLCLAQNSSGKVSCCTTVIVTEKKTVEEPGASREPVFLKHLTDLQVMDGSQVVMTVEVSVAPPAEILWFHNGKEIQETEDFHFEQSCNEHRLCIQEVFPEDTGIYTCKAWNSLGQATTEATLNNVILSCAIAGDPFPQIQLLKDGCVLPPSKILQSDDVFILILRNVQQSDGGHYQIKLNNAVGECSCQVSLMVEGSSGGHSHTQLVTAGSKAAAMLIPFFPKSQANPPKCDPSHCAGLDTDRERDEGRRFFLARSLIRQREQLCFSERDGWDEEDALSLGTEEDQDNIRGVLKRRVEVKESSEEKLRQQETEQVSTRRVSEEDLKDIPPEKMDFRANLQKQVKPKALSEDERKVNSSQQVDFRSVLGKKPSTPKTPLPDKVITKAAAPDFRSVLGTKRKVPTENGSPNNIPHENAKPVVKGNKSQVNCCPVVDGEAVKNSVSSGAKSSVPSVAKNSGPNVTKTSVPSADKTSVSSAEKTSVPSANKTIVPNSAKTIAPSAEKTIAPSAKKTIAPSVEKTSAEKTIAPSAEKTIAPSVKKTIAPSVEKTIAPSVEKTSAEKTIAPSAENTIAPSAEKTISPGAEKDSAPSVEKDSVPSAATKPEFLEVLQDVHITDGEKLVLQCRVTSEPPPTITWILDGKVIKSSKYIVLSQEGSLCSLSIEKTFPEDEGQYLCVAENSAGKAECACNVTAEDTSGNKGIKKSKKPRSNAPLANATETAPQILQFPEDRKVKAGESVELLCKVAGTQPITCTWMKFKKEIKESEFIKIENTEETSKLTISSARQEHCGCYTLVVENKQGSKQAQVNLTVFDKPDPPAGVPCASVMKNLALTLSWYGPTYDGGSVVESYRVEIWDSVDKVWTDLTSCRSTSFNLENLLQDREYKFRVRATNIHGTSEPSQESEPVTCKEKEEEHKEEEAEVSDDEGKESEPEYRDVTINTTEKVTDYYDVEERLGTGKFGQVFRIVEKKSKKIYAGKFLKAYSAKDKEGIRQEIATMNCLHHPKLVQCVDAFESKADMVMVLELVSGGELFERIIDEDFELTEREVIKYMKQICEGVEFIHKQGIVHLDLKPENIMCVNKTGTKIKLIDFGLARRLESCPNLKVLFGTPEFVAPEVINYEPIGYSTDMWSIGVICYILVSGLSPFMGDNDNETLANVTSGTWDFDDEAFDEISEEAKDFISSLLKKAMKNRLNCTQCLQHSWLQKDTATMEAKKLSKERMKKYMARRKWQKTGHAVRAIGRLSSLAMISGLSGRKSSGSAPTSPLSAELEISEAEDNQAFLESMSEEKPPAKPLFTKTILDIEVVEGSAARFDCRIEGHPDPEVIWYKDDQPIKESRHFQIDYDEDGNCSLTISEVCGDDDTKYSCKAVNSQGEATCTAELIVEVMAEEQEEEEEEKEEE